jgi:hypothetical protein
VSEKGAFRVAQIIPLGFVTATNAALTANVPAPSGFPLRCNKVLIQAFKTANSSDSVFVGLKNLKVGIRLTQVAPICSIQGWWKNIHEI